VQQSFPTDNECGSFDLITADHGNDYLLITEMPFILSISASELPGRYAAGQQYRQINSRADSVASVGDASIMRFRQIRRRMVRKYPA